MNTVPAISCILPLYNQARFVGEAVTSVLAQTEGDFELIVIDDGSTDDSAEIVAAFNDHRITLLRNSSNIGTTGALNIGLQVAKGAYLARMDADDVSLPHRFALQRSFMEENNHIAVCGSHVMTIGARSEVVRRPLGAAAIKCFLLAGPPFSHASVMMRRSVLERWNLQYDEIYRTAQDYDLWLRLLSVADGWNLNEVLLKHRLHADQISLTRSDEQSRNADAIRRRVLSMIGIAVSDHDLDRHTRLFRQQLEPGGDNLCWAEGWLTTIAARNSACGLFDCQALEAFLNETLDAFRQTCRRDGTARPGRLGTLVRSLLNRRH